MWTAAGTLSGAAVSIGTGFLAGDTLNFTNQNGITGSYNAATGVLMLSGTASLANYQAALDSITFSVSPGTGDPTPWRQRHQPDDQLDGQRRGDGFRCRDEHVEHGACRTGGDRRWHGNVHWWRVGGDIGWGADTRRCRQWGET